jgi:hypothetical protein
MRIRFRTFIACELIAFFAGMVTMVYITSGPLSPESEAPEYIERKAIVVYSEIAERAAQLVKCIGSRSR